MTQLFKATNSVDSKLDLAERILANRSVQSGNASNVGILLSGDPGTGKTSSTKFLAHLFGVDLIVIEAPHITEEHIINIPFIVFNDEHDIGRKGNQTAVQNGPSIVLADSHLFTQLRSARITKDEVLLQHIYSSHEQYQKVWEELGGNRTTIPKAIAKFRSTTNVILFIDEFFRNPSPRIKNMLRGILNGKIGTHDLPKNSYVMYASNLRDEGVSEMPANNDFEQIQIEVPNKEEWFSWFVNKHKDVNMDVIHEFYALLKQEHLSSHDVDADVRASPRTWEQVLLYISSSLPVANEKSAKSLITNIRSKFANYKSGEQHHLATSVIDAISKLIKKTSDIEIGTTGNSPDEWRSTLEHQIEQKMKLGKLRTYIPIVSGPPGIGKTSEVARTAHDLDLRYIYIDCSTLDPEMIMGIPVSSKAPGADKIAVEFSSPQLYTQIMDDIKKEDEAHIKNLSPADRKAYAAKKFKYLIFFDEMNRTSVKVFNGLRRVLLEKDFGHGLELPDESVIIAAINPHDLGTQDLTLHMRDVVDVIDSQPSWKKTSEYLDALKIDAAPAAVNIAKNTVIKLLTAFKDPATSRPADQKQFYMNMGETPLYISPREIVSMLSNTASNFDLKLDRLKPYIETDDLEKRSHAVEVLSAAVFNSIKGTLSNAMHKQQIDAPEFMHELEAWIKNNIDFDGIFSKKVETLGLSSIIEPYFKDSSKDLSREIELINYVEGHDLQNFKEELSEYLIDKLKSDKTHLTQMKHPLHGIKDGKLTKDQNKLVSTLEHLIRGLVLAFKVNKVSADMFDGVKFATRDAMSELIRTIKAAGESDEDLIMEAVALNGRLISLFKA